MVAIGGHVLVSPSTTTGVFLRSGDRAVGLSAEHHRYDAGGVEIGADRFHRRSPSKMAGSRFKIERNAHDMASDTCWGAIVDLRPRFGALEPAEKR